MMTAPSPVPSSPVADVALALQLAPAADLVGQAPDPGGPVALPSGFNGQLPVPDLLIAHQVFLI